MKTVFLTGISGLVGSYIARRLLEAGYRLRALRRNPQFSLQDDIPNKGELHWVEGDLSDMSCLEAGIAGADIVIHSAGVVSFAPRDRRRMYTVNVEGTRRIVDVCLDVGVKKLIHLSSIAALGRNPQYPQVDETSTWIDSDLNSHYAYTKYEAELEVWRGIAEGLPTVILNPSIVLGAGDWTQSSTRLFRYVWQERPFYSPAALNYVDVRDVAEIVKVMAENELAGERYIVNAGRSDYRTVFATIAQHFGKRAPMRPITPFIAEAAWRFSAVLSWLTGKAPLITRETARLAQHSFEYKNDKLRRAIDFEYRPLSDTLAWVCAELKQRYG